MLRSPLPTRRNRGDSWLASPRPRIHPATAAAPAVAPGQPPCEKHGSLGKRPASEIGREKGRCARKWAEKRALLQKSRGKKGVASEIGAEKRRCVEKCEGNSSTAGSSARVFAPPVPILVKSACRPDGFRAKKLRRNGGGPAAIVGITPQRGRRRKTAFGRQELAGNCTPPGSRENALFTPVS